MVEQGIKLRATCSPGPERLITGEGNELTLVRHSTVQVKVSATHFVKKKIGRFCTKVPFGVIQL
jgi:hypothetical protein